MKSFPIRHDGKTYHLAANINVVRSYARKRGINTVNDAVTDLMGDVDKDNVSFEVFDRYGTLLQCGLEEGARLNGEHFDLALEDVMLIMQDSPDAVHKILMLIVEDQVKVNPQMPRARKNKTSPGRV